MPDNTIYKIMMQDVQLSDEALWKQFRTYCQQNNYTMAESILSSNPGLQKKIMSAANINHLTGNIYAMEELYQDNLFDKEQIPVTTEQPTTQTSGQLWFKIVE